MNDSVEVLINLCHDFDLPLLDFLSQGRPLVNEILGAPTKRLQIVHDLFTILFEDEHYMKQTNDQL